VYASSIVDERLQLAKSEFGFTLDYKSVEEVESFERRLKLEGKYTYDDKGAPFATQNLSLSDQQWMLNEQVLVMCDAAYSLTRYAFIKDEQNVIYRFKFRVPQKILFDIICDLDASKRTLEFIILKARQLGISTVSLAVRQPLTPSAEISA